MGTDGASIVKDLGHSSWRVTWNDKEWGIDMRTRIIIMSIVMAVWIIVAAGILARDAHAGIYFRNDDGSNATRWNRTTRNYRIPLPDAIVTVREHPAGQPIEACGDPTALGCTYEREGGQRIIEIVMDANARSSFAHEVGHVFDASMLTDKQRRRFQYIDGSRGTTWTEGDYEWRSEEHFANAYATCALRGMGRLTSGDVMFAAGVVSYVASVQHYRQTCRLIDRAALGTGLLDYAPKPIR